MVKPVTKFWLIITVAIYTFQKCKWYSILPFYLCTPAISVDSSHSLCTLSLKLLCTISLHLLITTDKVKCISPCATQSSRNIVSNISCAWNKSQCLKNILYVLWFPCIFTVILLISLLAIMILHIATRSEYWHRASENVLQKIESWNTTDIVVWREVKFCFISYRRLKVQRHLVNVGISSSGFFNEQFNRQIAYADFFIFKVLRCVWVKGFCTKTWLFFYPAWDTFSSENIL